MKALSKLEAELSGLAEEVAAATAEAGRLQGDRPDVLLKGSDDDLRTLDEAIARAQRTRERAEAKREDCERRLQVARADKEASDRAAMLKAAEQAGKQGAMIVRDAFRQIACIVADVRDKTAPLVDAINAANREGDTHVPSIEERLAAGGTLPERILSEEVVAVWHYEGGGAVIESELNLIRALPDDPTRGIIRVRAGDSFSDIKVMQKKFSRREFLPREDHFQPDPLHELLDRVAEVVFIPEVEDTRAAKVTLHRIEDAA